MKIILASLFLFSACATPAEAKKPKPKTAMRVAPAQVFCQKFHEGKGCVTCDPNSPSAKFYYCVSSCDDKACKPK